MRPSLRAVFTAESIALITAPHTGFSGESTLRCFRRVQPNLNRAHQMENGGRITFQCVALRRLENIIARPRKGLSNVVSKGGCHTDPLYCSLARAAKLSFRAVHTLVRCKSTRSLSHKPTDEAELQAGDRAAGGAARKILIGGALGARADALDRIALQACDGQLVGNDRAQIEIGLAGTVARLDMRVGAREAALEALGQFAVDFVAARAYRGAEQRLSFAGPRPLP